MINNYCYISGTFTIPGHYDDYEKIGTQYYPRVGNVISSAGVGPYNAGRKSDGTPITEVEVKAYYQWVPFMLFLQGVMFYVPHIIYKAVEGKKLKVSFQKVITLHVIFATLTSQKSVTFITMEILCNYRIYWMA